ncbi:hypothetical protein [Nocardia asiatica]|uniref:SbtR family transcriptional regulator n=1 Tax=Nocardia asiatica TaxID=209252 RepID=UPI003EE031AF
MRQPPPLVDPAAIAARHRIAATLERFLADGRAAGAIRPGVTAADIVVCAALLTQPLPRTTSWSALADRHLTMFVDGLGTATGEPLAGPAPGDLEELLRTPPDPERPAQP